MRKFFVAIWLLLPVGALAYHYGPGQERMLLDQVAGLVAKAEGHVERAAELAVQEGDDAARVEWALAENAYTDALADLPEGRVDDSRRLRLERAKAQMQNEKLPTAHADLEALVDELDAQKDSGEAIDEQLFTDARSALASSQYYMTWLMRLEGRQREEWEPKIEAARQNYKWLAEASQDRAAAEQHQKDLESSIRLARMDLTELQGLPLPSQ